MCDNFFDDDGIDALEMALILAVSEEISEENSTPLSDEPLSQAEMLKSGNEIFDNDEE